MRRSAVLEPREIYRELHQAVARGDRHSSRIASNQTGLLNGADERQARGEIDEKTLEEIEAVVAAAGLGDFRPLMYVIPYDRVSRALQEVPVASRAHPLSVEYVIPGLSRKDFDVIEY